MIQCYSLSGGENPSKVRQEANVNKEKSPAPSQIGSVTFSF